MILLLILHLLCVLLVWLGIRAGVLKAKKYMLPVVLFIPLWGVVTVLLLHFEVGMNADGGREIGVERMRINEEIYRNIFVEPEDEQKGIVPLEEALIINRPGLRRDLIMDVLNGDPEEYIGLLQQARLNDDTEVVHYAATAMAELSKEFEFKLQKLEHDYSMDPENAVILDEYCSFLGEYIENGMMQGQMELMQRQQYSRLLQKKLEHEMDLKTCVSLVKNQLVLKDYHQAEQTLKWMEERWPRREEYWLMKLRFLAQQSRGKEISDLLDQIEQKQIYFSAGGKTELGFWKRGGMKTDEGA